MSSSYKPRRSGRRRGQYSSVQWKGVPQNPVYHNNKSGEGTTDPSSPSSSIEMPVPPEERRRSNELGASVRLESLRRLQRQLAGIIQDANTKAGGEADADADGGGGHYPTTTIDDSANSRGSSVAPADEIDVEAGGGLLSRMPSYTPRSNQSNPPASSPSKDTEETGGEFIVTRRMSSDFTGSIVVSSIKLGSTLTSDDSTTLPPEVKGADDADAQPEEADNDARVVAPGRTLSMTSDSTTGGNDDGRGIKDGDDDDEGQGDGDNSVDDRSTSSRTSLRSRFGRSRKSPKSSRNASPSPARSLTRGLSRRRQSSMSQSSSASNSRRRSSLLTKSMGKKSLRHLPTYDFLSEKENPGGQNKEEGSLRPNAKWWHGVFVFSIVSMLACVITLWAPYPIGARMPSYQIAGTPWSDGCRGGLESCICPRETVCADDLLSMVFLTIARSSAWFDYPLYMLLFMSKANNLNNFLQRTALRCFVNFSDYHRVHSLFGMIVGVESVSHAFFHLLRWARRKDDIRLLWTSSTGITGLIAITITPFIVLPMTVPYLKKRMRFEWRKALHYFSVLWGVALMFHAPQRIFWLIGVPFFIYTADKLVEGLFKTHLVESAHFQRLGDTSCIISFENPPGFGKQNSAYVYLMLPWLSKYQFHAFTVFPCTKPNHSSICIHKCGDWTGKLMKTITVPTHKPAFVVGPFLSPFSSPAMDSENLVAVASGIGVTPAISLIKQYSCTSRRLNLVWICRDPGLIEHFLSNVDFGTNGYTLIYYTGRERSLLLRDDLPPSVLVFNGRPNLERAIGGIVSSIATGEGLPEEMQVKVLSRTPAEIRSKLLLERALSIYTMDQLYDYTVKASNHYNNGLEPLVGMVNYRGVLSTMKHLLGEDGALVTDKITRNFEQIDTDGDCKLNLEEFKGFFNLMIGSDTQERTSMANIKRGLKRMSTTRDMFDSGHIATSDKDEFGIKPYLQDKYGKFAARNWNMLYCGGSQPVLDQLKAFKYKFGIGLSVEKFDW